MYKDNELLPISGLQHLLFCERQVALIHLEGIWEDNRFTIEGSYLHKRVDETAPRRERRGDLVILRRIALRSSRLGLVGRADVVELHREERENSPDDLPPSSSEIAIGGLPGFWIPFPVEYKRGRSKANYCDKVQLCAQAVCLEEMLGATITEGALFYGREKHRHHVAFNRDLRQVTEETAQRFHRIIADQRTPQVDKAPKCDRCSLLDLCMPSVTGHGRSACHYLQTAVS